MRLRLGQFFSPAPSHVAARIAQTLRLVLLAFPFAVLFWFLNGYFVFSGNYRIAQDFCNRNVEVTSLQPGDRVDNEEESCVQTVTGNPVWVDVTAPRGFDRTALDIQFDPKEQPVINVGLRRLDLITVDEQGLYSRLLDDPRWTSTTENDIILFQKTPAFASVGDFLKDQTYQETHSIASFHYPLPLRTLLSDVQIHPTPLTINKKLRGTHAFMVYVKKGMLRVSVRQQDLNYYEGGDPLTIEISQFGQTLERSVMDDDGILSGGGMDRGPIRSRELIVPNLTEGAYRVDLRSTDDIIIHSIETDAERIVAVDHLFLADNEEYFKDLDPVTQPTNVIFHGPDLNARTPHPNGYQSIRVGELETLMDQANKLYAFHRLGEKTDVRFPKNDVLVDGNGTFAFDSAHDFQPVPSNLFDLNERPDTTFEDVDIAIGRYRPTTNISKGLRKATIESALPPYLSKIFQFHVQWDAPGLTEEGEGYALHRLDLLLQKPPISWSRIQSYLHRNVQRIF